MLASQAPSENVSLPLGKQVSGIDHQPGRGDGRHPEVRWGFDALSPRAFMNRQAASVVHAVPDHRPTVVQSGKDSVELVPTLRSVLGNPDVSRLRMDGQTLRVPVSVAPDFGACIPLAGEGIVGGHTAVVIETIDGAVVVRDILRGVGLQVSAGRDLTFTHRDEDVPVGIEREPRSEVTSPTPGLGNEDVFKVHEPVVHKTPPPQRGGRLAAVTDRLGIG